MFDIDTIKKISKHDFLIEVHLHVDRGIGVELMKRFSDTHDITGIVGVGDHSRPFMCSEPFLKKVPVEQRYHLMSERRPETMEWLFLRSRDAA